MNLLARVLLGITVVVAGLAAICVWFVPDGAPTPGVWVMRVGFALVAIAAYLLAHWSPHREDIALDFLSQYVGVPFEYNGMSFCFSLSVQGGAASIGCAFQNQYASACDFRCVVRPPLKTLRFARLFPGIEMQASCEGGALGFVRAPIGVPAAFQGRTQRFEVAAGAIYPTGKGKRLRFAKGLKTSRASATQVGSALLTGTLLALGFVRRRRASSITWSLPRSIAEQASPPAKCVPQILWKPGDPTEGIGDVLKRAMAGA